jgi:phosphate transport system protein
MGVIAEVQLADAIEALLERDANKATRVIESNSQLDNLKTEVDELVVQRLVSPQPIAKIL